MATPIRIKRSAVPGKVPSQGALQYGELAFNLNDAELYAVRNRSGIGSDVVRIGAGASITNVLYVTKDGNDANTGRKPGDAKATISNAVSVASTLPGTVIRVSAGVYEEANPIKLGEQVSIIGDSLREVTIVPRFTGDLFYVSNGNYIAEVSFAGPSNTGAIISFDPSAQIYTNQSPYIQNCTNFIPDSIGMKVDGSKCIGPLKSMVVDSYTQYNQGGIGVSITKNGYAQLVSIFTICNDTAIFCGSGGACDITNSNSSFGNYGIVADGISGRRFTGIVTSAVEANSDKIVLDLTTPVYNVSNAQYSNTTGSLNITLDTSVDPEIVEGMTINVSGLEFTCDSDGNTGIVTYPSGKYGNLFEVDSIANISGLVTSVSHTGTASTLRATAGQPTFIVSPQHPLGVPPIATGLELLVQIDPDGSINDAITIRNAGIGYTVGEQLIISDSELGATGAPDVNITIEGIRTQYNLTTYVGVSTIAHNYSGNGTINIHIPRPFDGQVTFIDDLYYTVNRIAVGSGGTGYLNPAIVTIDPPSTIGDWGIQATAVAEMNNGSVDKITIVSAGRGYTSTPNITISSPDVGINSATAQVELLPTYYSVSSSTEVSSGICTVTFNENIPYNVGVGSTVPFFRQSRALATGHSFEYIGSGTSSSTALPYFGGVPDQERETQSRNGGLVVYTSTDQAGNFRIGDGVVINQLTGSISGTIYSKSLFSTMTPFILALGGD